MATLKQRLHRKNGSSYDTIHLETNATVVKMSTTDNTTLSTKIKNIDTEMNSVKTSVSNGKSLIASAITDKGVSTASDATFQTMTNNIRSITSISLPKLIPGNVLWSIGTTDIYGKPEYSAYTPPIFAQDPNCIIVGHKILSNYNTITGKSSVSTSGYKYYFYNIINGNMYLIRPSSGFTTTLTNDVKNGDPYIIIFSCPNSAGYSHKVILLQ